MKTIEEAAKHYATRQPYGVWKDNAETAFLEGVKYAQQWISVDEALPEGMDNVLVKILCEPYPPTKCASPPNDKPFTIISMGHWYDGGKEFSDFTKWHIVHSLIENKKHCRTWAVTHWRPIELK